VRVAHHRGLARTAMVIALLVLGSLGCYLPSVSASVASHSRFLIPSSARELVVVSSPNYNPPGSLMTFRTYQRTSSTSPWVAVFPPWRAETGSGHLVNVRREGDHATPTGVFAFGRTFYGVKANPGGLHETYHRLICGDWWDEDPYSRTYNRLVHVACGTTPDFAAWSEPLWTETRSYPYLAVINFNMNPTVRGRDALGSGIFLHAWMYAPTEGCVALRIPQLLRVLRWLRVADHPVIEIGTNAEVGHVPPVTASS
jgi:L,D-peptidoglycan transpeptidase YkuD (ErfK/YbiS/YcfS/YnhG family)